MTKELANLQKIALFKVHNDKLELCGYFNNTEGITEYLTKVKDGNPLAPSSDFKALAKSQIKGYATTHAKQQGVAPGKESKQWNNIVENAEREYPLLFAN